MAEGQSSHLPTGTAPSTGAPLTTQHRSNEPDTVPTASATGAPRIFPRHTEAEDSSKGPHPGKKIAEVAGRDSSSEDPSSAAAAGRSARRHHHHPHSSRHQPRHEQRSSSGYEGNGEESDSDLDESEYSDDDYSDEDRPPPREMAPSGSLTLAALSPSSSLPLSRRAALLSSAILINLGLPFINGIMLGMGEIVARTLLAPWLGVLLGPILPARWGFGTGQAGLGAGVGPRRSAHEEEQQQRQRRR
ncbi:hypothetical protein OC845_006571 [Tilletia horrida]|nr:hypothetical protein OC845_006571 [Tilletia horrida]